MNRPASGGARTADPGHQPASLALYLETPAWIAETDGRHGRAARLLGAVHTVWRSTGTPPSGPRYFAPFHDHCGHHVRTAPGEEQFTVAFQHGTRLTLDQATDCALDQASEQANRNPSPHRHPTTGRPP